MKRFSLALITLVFAHWQLQAQMDSLALTNAIEEFEHLALKGLQADKVAYFKTMAPTLEECRAVFKAGGADLVYLQCKNGLDYRDGDLTAAFVDFKTAHFSSAELKTRPEFLASQQREMRDYLLPNLVLFQIAYLDTENAVPLRYFLKINGRRVFFVDPWKAFVTQD